MRCRLGAVFACSAWLWWPALVLAQVPATPVLWSLQPLPPPNELASAAIDDLVDAELRARDLVRQPQADRRTLLRRAQLLLTGLPPTPAAVAAFVADPEPQAYGAVVDNLLTSTDCAEHLARRWLDLARYSDSNGLDENLAFGQAWRYRDWVVRAFAQDLPYDRFGKLQLAGDLLPDDDPAPLADRLVATGFLALGPRMLAEQDKEKLVLDTVDEQLDLVGRTFLGLTLGCARCHDHKFDPVPTRDYYALAGIFKSTQSFENLDHVSRWVERPLLTKAEVAARDAAVGAVTSAEQELQRLDATLRRSLPDFVSKHLSEYLLAGWRLPPDVRIGEAEAAVATNLATDARQWGGPGCVVLHTRAAGVQFAEYAVAVPAGRYRLSVRLAAKEARAVRVLVDGQVQIDNALGIATGDWFPASQRWVTAGEIELAAGQHVVRLEGTGPHMPHLDKWSLARLDGAGAAWPDNLDAALAKAAVRNAAFAVRAHDTELGRAFAAAGTAADDVARACAQQLRPLLTDHAAAAPTDGPDKRGLPAALAPLLGNGGVFELHDGEWLQLLPAPAQQQRATADAALRTCKEQVPPAPPMALCIAEGPPCELPVHLRGSHLTLAAQRVPRGFLSALANQLPAPAIPSDRSGRLELAEWLFDPRHPLTARVAVNRCWQLLFGEGLARDESNFGMRGAAPTHPALLDALAASLIADGWSLRRTLRRILMSATWQQQSTADERERTLDPDNLWLARQRRQRLPAEAIRDSMLAVAGALQRQLGGSLLEVENRAYVTNDQSNDRARYDVPRRSLYLPVIRNAMYDVFAVFDYADPSVHQEQRPTTAVATQALVLWNSPLVHRLAAQFATASEAAGDDAARVEWIWQQALQRAPSPAERDATARWLAASPDERRWPGLCQTLFATNEFVFVD